MHTNLRSDENPLTFDYRVMRSLYDLTAERALYAAKRLSHMRIWTAVNCSDYAFVARSIKNMTPYEFETRLRVNTL